MKGLLTHAIPANLADLMSTGQIRMTIEPNTKQPRWQMRVKTHGALTVGSWYAIGWKTKTPTTAALAAGQPWMVGQATETTGATASWTWLNVAGYVYQIASSGAIADGAGVEVLTGTPTVVIDDGTDHPLMSVNGIGHAVCAASGNLVDVWLYGREWPTSAAA